MKNKSDIKKIKITFTITVDTGTYMREYGMDDPKEIARAIMQDARDAAIAHLMRIDAYPEDGIIGA
jgi:hypothetical protein